MSLPAVLQHVVVLEASGLVTSEKVGRVRTCHIASIDSARSSPSSPTEPPKEPSMPERSALHATFTIERTYDRPPTRVFAAWADPGLKSRWFGGGTDLDTDFRVGGHETDRGEPGAYEASYVQWAFSLGEHDPPEGDDVEEQPPHRLQQSLGQV